MGNLAGHGKIQIHGRSKRSRSGSPGLDKSLRAGQSSGGVGLGDALQLPKEDIAGAMRVLRAPAACSV